MQLWSSLHSWWWVPWSSASWLCGAVPPPSFASLIENPDTTLSGTVAFISEAKDPESKNPDMKERQACARVSLASGAVAKDVYCWTISESALATAVWRGDGRLLVTGFEASEGDQPAAPVWAKVVEVTTGMAEDVPEEQLGRGARPSDQPVESPDGERISMTSGDGVGTDTMSGPSGTRTLLEIDRADPDWSLQSGPVWSPDFAWVMTWDGRLLLTTDCQEPATRVLAEEALVVAGPARRSRTSRSWATTSNSAESSPVRISISEQHTQRRTWDRSSPGRAREESRTPDLLRTRRPWTVHTVRLSRL